MEMVRSLVDKVMWVGRATVFMVGLVAILALLLALAYVTLVAGGEPDRTDVIPQQVRSGGEGQVLALETLARRRAPTQGFARVASTGDFDPTRSKQVNDVVKPSGQTGVFCFDLTFVPKIAVGSPYINNAAFIATSTRPDAGSTTPLDDVCPEGYRDLAVKTYGSDSQPHDQVNFNIVFMR